MKPITITSFLLTFTISLRAQHIAWYGQDRTTSGHMITLHVGADFGTVYGLSYGYKFSGKIPLVIGTELTTPFGGKIMDDFKAKLTAQTMFWPARHLGMTVQSGLSFLRNGTEAGIINNISAEWGTSIGYYQNAWSFAAEAVYTRSCATLFKHRRLGEYYPDIRDEWYASTGGTFKFGLQGSYWLQDTGVAVKAGKVYGQNFSDNPTIPFYADFSVMRRM